MRQAAVVTLQVLTATLEQPDLKETMDKLKDPSTMAAPTALQEAMEDFKYLKETQGALNDVLKSYGFGNVALNV